MHLLDLLFDEGFYRSSSNGALALETSWEGALGHYKNHSISSCFPPNEYFSKAENQHLLYEIIQGEKKCNIADWVTKSLTEKDYSILGSYASRNQESFIASIIRETKKNQTSVEGLIGPNAFIDILTFRGLERGLQQALGEETIVKCLNRYSKNPSAVQSLMIRDVKLCATEPAEAIKLSEFMLKANCTEASYGFLCNIVPENFLQLSKSGQRFLPGVFENFEQWVVDLENKGYGKNFESIARFIAKGIEEEMYEPSYRAIGILKGLVTKDKTLAYSAMALAIGSLIDRDQVDAALAAETIDFLAKGGEPILLWMLDYIVDSYVAGRLSDMALLVKFLETNLQAPSAIWSRLLDPVLKLLDNEIEFSVNTTKPDAQGIQDIALVLDRLSAYHIELPYRAKRLVEWRRANYPDDIFFTHYTSDEVLEEHKRLNEAHKDAEDLQLYLKTQLAKIHKINARSNYKFKWLYDKKPSFVRRGVLYIYTSGNQIICHTRSKDGKDLKIALKDLNIDEKKALEDLFRNKKTPQLKDIEIVERASGYSRELSSADFLKWRNTITDVTNDNIAEVLSMLAYGMHVKHFKRTAFVRDCQLLAVLSFFHSNGKNRLLQVGTGEGKTEDVALFAAIKVLQGRKPDIATSSDGLAEREVRNLSGFYNLFGITVAHNIPTKKYRGGIKECYRADIVYGELFFFLGDLLQDISENIKDGRVLDLLIVDEVDNTFIDQTNLKVRLASAIPGFEALKQMLIHGYGHLQTLLSLSSGDEENSYLYIPKDSASNATHAVEDDESSNMCMLEDLDSNITDGALDFEALSTDLPYRKFLEGELIYHLNSTLYAGDRSVVIPAHLENFVPKHLSAWVQSIIDLLWHEKDKHYRVQEATRKRIVKSGNTTKEIGDLIIAPIDYDVTGQVQEGVRWNNGLHPLLELRHGLPLRAEGLVDVFKSYVGYVLKYSERYGLSATLGTESHKELFQDQDIYKADTVIIPSFIKKKLETYPAMFAFSYQDWVNKIVDSAISVAKDEERPVFIVMHTIGEVDVILDQLRSKGHPEEKLFRYIDSSNVQAIENTKCAGDIVVGTYILGRGTDIKKCKSAWGAHIIISNFPDSVRLWFQFIGRVARKEDRGSAQMILDASAKYWDCYGDLACFEARREAAEAEILKEMVVCGIPYIKLDDELFEKSVRLVRMVEAPTSYDLVFAKDALPNELREDSIYIYVQDGKEVHLVSPWEGHGLDLDITDSLKNLDHKAFIQIIAASKKHNNEKYTFNRRDFELLHFIAALNGHDFSKVAIKRVVVAYEMLWVGETERQYLERKMNKALTEVELVEAREAELFRLWKEELITYHKRYEIRQMLELFAIWLKIEWDISHKQLETCDVTSETAIAAEKEKFARRAKEVRQSFISFEIETINALKNGSLMQNPAHLVKRALSLQVIHGKQSQIQEDVIQLRSTYPFLEKAEPKSFAKVNKPIIAINGTKLEQKPEENSWLNLWGRLQEGVNWVSDLLSGKIKKSELEIYDPLGKAIEDLDRAISLEKNYSWPAYDVKSYMIVIKDGPAIVSQDQAEAAGDLRNKFIHSASPAREKLLSFEIPKLEGELAFMVLSNITVIGSPIARDYIFRIKAHKALAEHIENNINIALSATDKQVIRIGEVISLEDLVSKVNVTKKDEEGYAKNLGYPIERNREDKTGNHTAGQRRIELSEFNQPSPEPVLADLYASGVLLFNIRLEDLREEKEENDWFGYVFAGLFGLGKIFVGLAFMGVGGPFSVLFGTSLFMQGVGDLFMIAEHLIERKGIDLAEYVKASAIGIAVAFIVASIGHIGAGTFKIAPDVAAMSLTKAFTIASVVNIGSRVITRLADSTIKKNAGAIKLNIEDQVLDFMEDHARDLELICASAAYKAEQASCDANTYNAILKEASSLINEHVKTYHGSVQTVMKGVSSGMLGLAASGNPFGIAAFGAAVGIEAGAGIFEATTSTSYVLRNLDTSSAAGSSLTAPAMFNLELKKEYPIDSADIIKLLSTAGFPESANPTLPCTSLASINLGSFDVRPSCDKINALYSPSASESAKAQLSVGLKDALFKRMRGIISQSFVQPAAGFIASSAADPISDKVEAHVKKMQARERAERQAVLDKGGKGPASPWQDPDKLEKTNLKELTKDETKKLDAYKRSQFNRVKEAREALAKEPSLQKANGIRQKLLEDLNKSFQRFSRDNPALSGLARASVDVASRPIEQQAIKPILSLEEFTVTIRPDLDSAILEGQKALREVNDGSMSRLGIGPLGGSKLPRVRDADVKNYVRDKYHSYLNGIDIKDISFSLTGVDMHSFSKGMVRTKQLMKQANPVTSWIAGRIFDAAGDLTGAVMKKVIVGANYCLKTTLKPKVYATLKQELTTVAIAIDRSTRDITPTTREAFGDISRVANLGGAIGMVKTGVAMAKTGIAVTKAGVTATKAGVAMARGTVASLKGAASKASSAIVKCAQEARSLPNKAISGVTSKYLERIFQPLRPAVATNGAAVFGYIDDAGAGACKNPNALFSVTPKATISGTTTTASHVSKSGRTFKQLYAEGKIVVEDSGKHHIHSRGKVSRPPKNPGVIKDSLAIKDTSLARVAVDPINNEIVIFRFTKTNPDGTVVYHANTALWEALPGQDKRLVLSQEARNILLDKKLVNKKGRIL